MRGEWTSRIAFLTVLAVLGTASIAGVAAADAAVLQQDTGPNADVNYLDGEAGDGPIVVDAGTDTINLSAFQTADPDDSAGDLNYTWSVGDGADGDIVGLSEISGQEYPYDAFARYDIDEADAGSTFELLLEVEDPDGQTDSDSITVEVEESGGEPNAPPTASVVWAEDPSVEQPTVSVEDGTVDLDASDSADPDGDELTYEWSSDDAVDDSQISTSGETLTYDLTDADAGGELSFQVSVSDGSESDAAAISVLVDESSDDNSSDDDSNDSVEQPTAVVEYFDGNATDSVTVDASTQMLNFSGLQSQPLEDRANLTSEWSVSDGASGEFNHSVYPHNWTTSYLLGASDVGSTFDVQLEVTYMGETTDTDSFTVTVEESGGEPNEPPTASVVWAEDPSVEQPTVSVENGTVELDASDSSDADGDTLTYEWSSDDTVDGSRISTSDETLTYDLTDADAGSTLAFDVVVSDGNASDTATISVTVAESNAPPTASVVWAEDPSVAQPTVSVEDGTVELDASDSADPDGDALIYEWSGDDAVDDSRISTSGETLTYDLADADAGATLAFDVVVSDGNASDTATISVTVAEPDAPQPEPAISIPAGEGGYEDVTGQSLTFEDSMDRIAFSAEGTTDPNYDSSELAYEWSVDGAGELDGKDAEILSYHVANADRGETVTVELTAQNDGGVSNTATVDVTFEQSTEPDPGPDPSPTAALELLNNPSADSVTVNASAGPINLSALGSSVSGNTTLDYQWSADGDGELHGAGNYSDKYTADYFASYQPSEADAGSTVNVTVVVTTEGGANDTATFPITVNGNGSDGGDGDDGSDDNNGGGLPGGGGGPPSDGGDDSDDGSDDDSSDDGSDDGSDDDSSNDGSDDDSSDDSDGSSSDGGEGGQGADDPAAGDGGDGGDGGDDGGSGGSGPGAIVLILGAVVAVGAVVYYRRQQ